MNGGVKKPIIFQNIAEVHSKNEKDFVLPQAKRSLFGVTNGVRTHDP